MEGKERMWDGRMVIGRGVTERLDRWMKEGCKRTAEHYLPSFLSSHGPTSSFYLSSSLSLPLCLSFVLFCPGQACFWEER